MALEDILQQFRIRLGRDYVSSGIIGINGVHLAYDSIESAHNGTQAAAELAESLKDLSNMVKEINSGRLNYIIISTVLYKIFLYPVDKAGKYFNLLTIKTDGNIGKALLELERLKKKLDDELD